MKPSLNFVLAGVAVTLVALLSIFIYFIVDTFVKAPERRTAAVRALKEEFSVGKASADFIKRAKEIGADECSITPEATEPKASTKETQKTREFSVTSILMRKLESNAKEETSAPKKIEEKEVHKVEPPRATSFPRDPELYASALEDKDAYAEHLDRLDKKLRSLKNGSAEVQVTIEPPFLRAFCSIDFKDGKVTRVSLSKLD
ncbi:MAG: hypothetical protein K2X27_18980 [Candidatus Obscuribacterales bacterium]|nr:hypothetical protein [Candidatus Obscuribacterales bacterium]